jgi:hypothetical protein
MTPNRGKTARQLAAADQGYLERSDLLHAMPSAPLHDALRRLARHHISPCSERRGREAPWWDARLRVGSLLTTC